MSRTIKRFILPCLIALILECILYNVYSYFYTLSGNEPLTFSFSRVIAMLIIYWGTKGLMTLQKSPDYGITEGENQT